MLLSPIGVLGASRVGGCYFGSKSRTAAIRGLLSVQRPAQPACHGTLRTTLSRRLSTRHLARLLPRVQLQVKRIFFCGIQRGGWRLTTALPVILRGAPVIFYRLDALEPVSLCGASCTDNRHARSLQAAPLRIHRGRREPH